jgi:hypothetical protein
VQGQFIYIFFGLYIFTCAFITTVSHTIHIDIFLIIVSSFDTRETQ